MKVFAKEQKQVVLGIAAADLAGTIAALLLGAADRAWFLGLLLGTCFTYLNFQLLAISVVKAAFRPPEKAASYMRVQYMIRYLLTGLVLALGFYATYLNPLAVILPLLSVRPALMIGGIFGKGAKDRGN